MLYSKPRQIYTRMLGSIGWSGGSRPPPPSEKSNFFNLHCKQIYQKYASDPPGKHNYIFPTPPPLEKILDPRMHRVWNQDLKLMTCSPSLTVCTGSSWIDPYRSCLNRILGKLNIFFSNNWDCLVVYYQYICYMKCKQTRVWLKKKPQTLKGLYQIPLFTCKKS